MNRLKSSLPAIALAAILAACLLDGARTHAMSITQPGNNTIQSVGICPNAPTATSMLAYNGSQWCGAPTLNGYNLLLGRNLAPDSVVSSDGSGHTPYWRVYYGTGITTGWGVSVGGGTGGNALTFLGTGAAIPGGTDAVSAPVILPALASGDYTMSLTATVNATNATAGSVAVEACQLTAAGGIGACYIITTQAAGSSGVITGTSAAIPGTIGQMVVVALVSPSATVITSTDTVTIANFQIEIGSAATAYKATTGQNNDGRGPGVASWWPALVNGFLPETATGTLATTQTAVTLTTSEAPILSTVSSAAAFGFGGGEALPGLPTTSAFDADGEAEVQCIAVTTGGSATVVLTTHSIATGGSYSDFSSDGIPSLNLPIAVNSGTVNYVFPLHIAIQGNPVDADYGTYDFRAFETGVAPAGACQVIAAALKVTVYPTDSTTAGSNVIKGYGSRAGLLY